MEIKFLVLVIVTEYKYNNNNYNNINCANRNLYLLIFGDTLSRNIIQI